MRSSASAIFIKQNTKFKVKNVASEGNEEKLSSCPTCRNVKRMRRARWAGRAGAKEPTTTKRSSRAGIKELHRPVGGAGAERDQWRPVAARPRVETERRRRRVPASSAHAHRAARRLPTRHPIRRVGRASGARTRRQCPVT